MANHLSSTAIEADAIVQDQTGVHEDDDRF